MSKGKKTGWFLCRDYRGFMIAVLALSLFVQGVRVGAAQDRKSSAKGEASEVKKKARKKRSQRSDKQRPPIVVPPYGLARPNTPPAKVEDGANSNVAQKQETGSVKSRRITVASSSIVNFKQLSKSKQLRALGKTDHLAVPAPQTIDETPGPQGQNTPRIEPSVSDTIPGPSVPSPGAVANFQGQIDEAKVGTGTFVIPPDTMGAVGPDKVVVHVNNNYLVQNKQTGATLSKVSINTFWAAAGGTNPFDPRIVYDPYNNRFLVAAVSDAQSANSSVLFGISLTSDPEGFWSVQRLIVGCAPGEAGCNPQGEWADFPMLGFNKNWVAIGWNQFTINTGAFVAGKMAVINYPLWITTGVNGFIFTNESAASGFCMSPATTFSATEETLYVPAHQSSASALYRLHSITGTPALPVFNIDGTARTRPGGGWTQPIADIVPQQCVPGVGEPTQVCPASIRQIDPGDAFIRSNVVFRNGKIWYPQTIALPAGGITNNSRLAAQWTALNPDGTFFDGGRVEDATATRVNGGKHYFYPSLTVNAVNDVLLGFSEAESDDYVDAGYVFRYGFDPAGTMRDPVIYKEGEDYYSKTFSGSRNRWGDYSHTVVDPSNDLHMWTLQQYAMLRVGSTGTGSNDSRWGTWWAKLAASLSGTLLISEFRLRGPNGADDEFVEIYNPSTSAHTVAAVDASGGYAVAASDGVVRCTIPDGTVIPGRGHYLCVNSNGYSLSNYGGTGAAAGNASYSTDIPDNAGIALFATATPASFALSNRMDAVGSTSEANALYKEGTGYPALMALSINYSFYRDTCGKGGSITAGGPCPTGGLPKDTDNNATDFVFVDTDGTSAGAGQRLGAPGPQNLASPIQRNAGFGVFLIDSGVAASSPPNRVRDFTSDPGNNSTFGTLEIRRRFVNNTGGNVTRLRFRIVDQTTFPAPSGFADMRARTSMSVMVSGVNDAGTCAPNPAPCSITVQGTTLEQPPVQPNGGAFNSSLSAGTITLGTPLTPGASINLRFLLGLQQTGTFRFFINVEALP